MCINFIDQVEETPSIVMIPSPKGQNIPTELLCATAALVQSCADLCNDVLTKPLAVTPTLNNQKPSSTSSPWDVDKEIMELYQLLQQIASGIFPKSSEEIKNLLQKIAALSTKDLEQLKALFKTLGGADLIHDLVEAYAQTWLHEKYKGTTDEKQQKEALEALKVELTKLSGELGEGASEIITQIKKDISTVKFEIDEDPDLFKDAFLKEDKIFYNLREMFYECFNDGASAKDLKTFLQGLMNIVKDAICDSSGLDGSIKIILLIFIIILQKQAQDTSYQIQGIGELMDEFKDLQQQLTEISQEFDKGGSSWSEGEVEELFKKIDALNDRLTVEYERFGGKSGVAENVQAAIKELESIQIPIDTKTLPTTDSIKNLLVTKEGRQKIVDALKGSSGKDIIKGIDSCMRQSISSVTEQNPTIQASLTQLTNLNKEALSFVKSSSDFFWQPIKTMTQNQRQS